MRPLRKIQAGALQFVVFVSVVVAVLLSGFILLTYTHRVFRQQAGGTVKMVRVTDDAYSYIAKRTIPLRSPFTIPLQDKTLEVTAERDLWGIFEKIVVTSRWNTHELRRVALVGGWDSKEKMTALYVKDNARPLILTGNTRIQGNVLLPRQGVRPGNIAGTSYYGSQMIYGNVGVSTPSLPKPSNEVFAQTAALLHGVNDNTTSYTLWDPGMKLSNSFLEETVVIADTAPISIENASLSGNIMIVSKAGITVGAGAKLQDVILVAPGIALSDGVQGRLQAFATREIQVGKNCLLEYPSSLVVLEKPIPPSIEGSLPKSSITVNTGSEVRGVVLFNAAKRPQNYEPQVVISAGSTVAGEVYCNQNMELLGEVWGSVYINNFITKQSGSIYQNHLYHGKILNASLTEQYGGLLFEGRERRVIQWLY